MSEHEVKVPDIGGYDDVPVIEVLVKVGDTVAKDQGLLTLESDKATMEVPSSVAGVVKQVRVKVGDTLSEGSVVVIIEESAAETDAVKAEKPVKQASAAKPETPAKSESKPEEKKIAPTAKEAASSAGTVVEAKVPDVGDYADIPVIELLVSVGDTVKKDQALVTLESDKATMEVPSSHAGVVKVIKVKIGDLVSEGSVVALIEMAADSASAAAAAAPAGAASEIYREPVPPAANSAVESVEVGNPNALVAPVGTPTSPPVEFGSDTVMPDRVPHASPGVRMIARELGVDLFKVTGTERKGRISRTDVRAYVKQALSSSPATAAPGATGAGLNLLPWPKMDFAKFGEVETQALSRIKKISGANLHRNWVMIPHVTHNDEADITEMESFRKQLAQDNKDLKISPLVFQIKAVVAALKKFPHFNASLDASGENLVMKKYFNVGIAVDTPDGLMVPVIRDADRKGIVELATEMGEISKKAREKKLGPADMSGGCFSISSLGGIGGTSFTPIVNAPEVAILGVCKAAIKPVWNGEKFKPRMILPLSLSYDHRVIDGADAARFTAFLAEMLGDIRRLLL
ncbi:MAG: dihydrolipoyllysine-residue acetyltransferase [Dokdonella sp.]